MNSQNIKLRQNQCSLIEISFQFQLDTFKILIESFFRKNYFGEIFVSETRSA